MRTLVSRQVGTGMVLRRRTLFVSYLVLGALTRLVAVLWRLSVGCPAQGECYLPGWEDYYWLDLLFAAWVLGSPLAIVWIWRHKSVATNVKRPHDAGR